MNKYFQEIIEKIKVRDLKTIGKFLVIPTAFLNILLAFFLLMEYKGVRKKASQLELLQNDYQEYQRVLKQIIESYTEQQGPAAEQGAPSTLGPIVTPVKPAVETPFVLLNRDPKHLEKTVLVSALKEAEQRIRIKPRLKKRPLVVRPAHLPEDELPVYPLVKNAPLAWPLDKDAFWISSYFGKRKTRKGVIRFHAGIDMAAERGTLVKAAAPGCVEYAGKAGTFGSMILIAHDARYKTRYAHLSRVLVKDGTVVKQGQIIGCVGNSGRVSGKNGNHLHFEVLSYGRAVNPMKFLG